MRALHPAGQPTSRTHPKWHAVCVCVWVRLGGHAASREVRHAGTARLRSRGRFRQQLPVSRLSQRRQSLAAAAAAGRLHLPCTYHEKPPPPLTTPKAAAAGTTTHRHDSPTTRPDRHVLYLPKNAPDTTGRQANPNLQGAGWLFAALPAARRPNVQVRSMPLSRDTPHAERQRRSSRASSKQASKRTGPIHGTAAEAQHGPPTLSCVCALGGDGSGAAWLAPPATPWPGQGLARDLVRAPCVASCPEGRMRPSP